MSDFIDRANTICRNVSSSAAALPTPNTSTGSLISPEASDLPAIANYFPTVLNVLQSLDSQLHALGTPPSMQVLWAQALAAYETLLSDAEAAQTAAQSRDLTAYDHFFVDVRRLPQGDLPIVHIEGRGVGGCRDRHRPEHASLLTMSCWCVRTDLAPALVQLEPTARFGSPLIPSATPRGNRSHDTPACN